MIFVLKPLRDWEPWYDCVFCFVVRASSEHHARQIAANEHGDEGREAWLDSSKTSCEAVEPNGVPECICRDRAEA